MADSGLSFNRKEQLAMMKMNEGIARFVVWHFDKPYVIYIYTLVYLKLNASYIKEGLLQQELCSLLCTITGNISPSI